MTAPNLAGPAIDVEEARRHLYWGGYGDTLDDVTDLYDFEAIRAGRRILAAYEALLAERQTPTVLRDPDGTLWVWLKDGYRANGERSGMAHTREQIEERWGTCTVVAR